MAQAFAQELQQPLSQPAPPPLPVQPLPSYVSPTGTPVQVIPLPPDGGGYAAPAPAAPSPLQVQQVPLQPAPAQPAPYVSPTGTPVEVLPAPETVEVVPAPLEVTDAGDSAPSSADAAPPSDFMPSDLEGITSMVTGLWDGLIASYGPAGPFYAIAGLGMLLALVAMPILLRKPKDPLDRFDFTNTRRDGELQRLRTDTDDGRLKNLGQYLEPQSEAEMSETRQKLAAAGYKGKSAVRVYFFARAIGGLGMLSFGLLVFLVLPQNPDPPFALVMCALFGLVGFFVPAYWVRRQIDVRREEIQNAFPDAMDMLLVCIEGGQSLEQALQRVGKEMEQASGPLSEELQTVSYEFRAGKDRIAVLRDFASRCAVNDISSFVTVLIQSTAFGTSISQALRVYASEMRDKRLMRAEEKANVLPTKLTLGTMMFTVPPLILILVGPSVIQIVRSLSGLSGGG